MIVITFALNHVKEFIAFYLGNWYDYDIKSNDKNEIEEWDEE